MSLTAYRAELFRLTDDPRTHERAATHIRDGLLVVRDGYVEAVGPYDDLVARLPADTEIVAFPGGLITPGFVDCHVHFPQVDVIASYGAQLMDWLARYTFPVEARFADAEHAREAAGFFLDELLRNGTTSALVFSTVHADATNALFQQAAARNMRIIAGKTLMDRGAPPELCETPDQARRETRALIEAWHGCGRLSYAVTPRFALACSPKLLAEAGALLRERPGLHLHTHLSENTDEIALVAEEHPGANDYLHVYERAGLVTDRSVFAHGVHLDGDAFSRLGAAGAALAHCPTSNLFLGSGLFNLAQAAAHKVETGLGTDVGGGTSFSLLTTMGEAYKVGQLNGAAPAPLTLFHLATLGGARALGVDAMVGELAPGKEADFVVLDRAATPLLARRMAQCSTIDEQLFVFSVLGDDRCVAKTYVAGGLAHDRDAERDISHMQQSGVAQSRPRR